MQKSKIFSRVNETTTYSTYIERRTSFVFMSSYRVACKNVFIIGSRFHVVGVSEGGQGKVDVRVGG